MDKKVFIKACLECGADVMTKSSKICRRCAGRHGALKRYGVIKPPPTCVDCGIEVTYRCKRCIPCNSIMQKNLYGRA